jgi:hypothetical protein
MRRILILVIIAAVTCAGSAFAVDAPTLTWTQLSPATSPSAREGPAMTYDPVSGKVLLFGGFGKSGYLNDTWTFDGTDWNQVTTTVAPPTRVAAAMAFDRVSRQVILFGGYDGHNYLADTWVWDGVASTWTQANPVKSPPGVTGPNAFTDPKNGHADVFGGFDGQFYQSFTWTWTGATWRHRTTANSPSARSGAVTALDASKKNVLLFAGLADVNPWNTWIWDGEDWTMQSPPSQPGNRYFGGGAFDPRMRVVVAFGGGRGGEDLNDTWTWDGSEWTSLPTTQSPPIRESFGMAYDAKLGHVVIFGGLSGAKVLGDTWELDPR